MPDLYTDSDLDELENREVVIFDDPTTQQRSFSEVYQELRMGHSRRSQRMNNVAYVTRLTEMAGFLRMVARGQISDRQLMETMSTSDFPILFGDILDTRLLNQYAATPNTWSQYLSRGTVADFRRSRLVALDGLTAPLYPSNRKAELTGVQYNNELTESEFFTQVEVYERVVSYNWRMLMNRRGDFLSRIPALLARAANRTEEKFGTDLYMDSTGPDATFFSVANANLVTGNPALSVTALKTALNIMYAQVDSDGQPIVIEGISLVVPPLLEVTADEILNATKLIYGADSAPMRFETTPWVSRFRRVTNWYQPVIDVSANKQTTWSLWAEPSANRPGGEVTFLTGYETPSLWQKAGNTMRAGSNTIDPMMGDFEDMSIHQKILHIIGGTLIDPKAAVASNGSGS